jgi:serine protease AprX
MARYFIRTPSVENANVIQSFFSEHPELAQPKRSKSNPTIMLSELDEHDRVVVKEQGGEIYEDVQFSVFPPKQDGSGKRPLSAEYWRAPQPEADIFLGGPSLSDVLNHIKAPNAWSYTRGGGVTLAIVDTGICGALKEFPPQKRSPIDLQTAFAGKHWTDVKGHGSMCATIAGGNDSSGGRFNGVAPDATILAARTTLSAIDLFNVFDELIDCMRSGKIDGPLVISNSYGLYTCDEPATLPEDHPYLEMVMTAIDEGAFVVFAAGNNHYDVLCNHDPSKCSPNTIWAVNSHDRVMSVGTVNADNSNQDPATPHANSSRGPGQWSRDFPKPDCVAPTYGQVVWGCGYRHMDWWGTSGACPQVAGLGALILSSNPSLRPRQVADIIRQTCAPLGAHKNCVGHGLIDCEAAVRAAIAIL